MKKNKWRSVTLSHGMGRFASLWQKEVLRRMCTGMLTLSVLGAIVYREEIKTLLAGVDNPGNSSTMSESFAIEQRIEEEGQSSQIGETAENSCGDGVCDANEDCASCPEDCGQCTAPSQCGNGVCEVDEDCDICPQDCDPCDEPPQCGNGVVDNGEECDDGNVDESDGCTNECKKCARSGQLCMAPNAPSCCPYKKHTCPNGNEVELKLYCTQSIGQTSDEATCATTCPEVRDQCELPEDHCKIGGSKNSTSGGNAGNGIGDVGDIGFTGGQASGQNGGQNGEQNGGGNKGATGTPKTSGDNDAKAAAPQQGGLLSPSSLHPSSTASSLTLSSSSFTPSSVSRSSPLASASQSSVQSSFSFDNLCGNGRFDIGEQCGERAMPPCPNASVCRDCRCVTESSSSISNSSLSSIESSTSSTSPPKHCNLCTNCGDGLFNLCDRDECLGLGDCVFDRKLLIGFCTPDPAICFASSSSSASSFVSLGPVPPPSAVSSPSSLLSSSSSLSPICGDGILDGTEECDDGNAEDFDGCTVFCSVESSSSLSFESLESSSVSSLLCGDGILSDNEECDDSNQSNNDGCSILCILEFGICGDGVIQKGLGEECEPQLLKPNTFTFCTDGCRITTIFCGNGKTESGEECDRGLQNADTSDALCRKNCSLPRCGDGILGRIEECDDGNTRDNDGCSRFCRLERFAGGVPSSYTGNIRQQMPPPRPPTHAPVGETGPATLAIMAAGAASGIGWVRKRRKK